MAEDTKFRPSEEAPYASLPSITAFFDAARMAKKPAKVDIDFINGLGQESSGAWALFPVVRFLGLIAGDGAPTEHYEMVYMSGENFAAALRDRIQEAYADLFGKVDTATADRSLLEEFFRINFSPKLARRQARTFVGLCQMAGIQLSEAATKGGTQRPAPRAGRGARDAKPTASRRPRERKVTTPPAGSARDHETPHEDLQTQYISALIKRIGSTSSEDEAKVLMDRVEKLLNISPEGRAADG